MTQGKGWNDEHQIMFVKKRKRNGHRHRRHNKKVRILTPKYNIEPSVFNTQHSIRVTHNTVPPPAVVPNMVSTHRRPCRRLVGTPHVTLSSSAHCGEDETKNGHLHFHGIHAFYSMLSVLTPTEETLTETETPSPGLN